MEELLKSLKVDPNKKSAVGLIPLCSAIAVKNTEIVKLLLANEQIDLTQTVNGYLPFHVALNFGTLDMVNAFLAKEFETIKGMVNALKNLDNDSMIELKTIEQFLSDKVTGKLGEKASLSHIEPVIKALGDKLKRNPATSRGMLVL